MSALQVATVPDYRLAGAPIGYLAVQAPAYYAWWHIHQPDSIFVRDPRGERAEWAELVIGGFLEVEVAARTDPAGAARPGLAAAGSMLHPAAVDRYEVEFEAGGGGAPTRHLVRFEPDRIELQLVHRLEHPARLIRCVLGGGAGRRSAFPGPRLFNPGPASHGVFHHPPDRPQFIRADWFTPPPFCFCLQGADGTWTSAALEPEGPDQMAFTRFATDPDAAGRLQFEIGYGSRPLAAGTFRSPPLVFRFGAPDEFAALRGQAEGLVAAGRAAAVARRPAPWWRGVMACGWHQQLYLERRDGGSAESHCTQREYEAWLDAFDAAGIGVDLVTVDMFWGRTHGIWEADPAKWPDLRGFVDRQHARGRRVLLWVCTGTQGLPDGEVYRVGERRLLDPANPAWRRRLEAACRWMLGAEPGACGADGLKFDFTDLTPPAGEHHAARERHGMQYLHDLFAAVHGAAKSAREDALLDFQVANPHFAGFYDMTRLNDFFLPGGQALRVMSLRAAVARAAGFDPLVDVDGPRDEDYFRESGAFGNISLYVDSADLADPERVRAIREGIERFRAAAG